MQLARLLYGLNTRTIGGKLEQIARASWLELRYSKHDLLEAHANLLPYGGNVQGIGAASLIYFGKRPAELSLAEALTLVVIPQSPQRRNPGLGSEPAALMAARQRLASRWREEYPSAGIDAPLRYSGPRQLPFEAPHLADSVLARSTAGEHIGTTLNLRQQHLLERVLDTYLLEQQRVGIRNGAAPAARTIGT